MALRARKRQGGGSTGTGSYDPRRPNVATGVGSTAPPVLGTPPTKGAGLLAPGEKPAVQAPSAAYVRHPPPGASAPIRGATSQQLRSNADIALNRAKGENRDSIYRAIMQLGDPSQFAKYQQDPNFAGFQFTQDPNSVWANLARQQEKGLQDIDVGANKGNTFFSGMRLGDRTKLTDEVGRQQLGATTSFGDDLRGFASALGGAEDLYRGAYTDADQMDIDAALDRDRVAREDWQREQDQLDAVAAAGPEKGFGSVPLGPSTGLVTPQQRSEAYNFAQRMAAQRAREAARRRHH